MTPAWTGDIACWFAIGSDDNGRAKHPVSLRGVRAAFREMLDSFTSGPHRHISRDHGVTASPECLGPESNRHGVSPEGFSYSLQLSLLHARVHAFGVWTLPLPCRASAS